MRTPRPQDRRDELARLAVENQQRVKHVLVVEAVEERELLLSVRRVVGGVDVEHDERRVRRQRLNVLILEHLPEPSDSFATHCVLQPRQRRLRRQSIRSTAVGADHLQERIVAHDVGVVAVLVAECDLVDALTKLLRARVHDQQRIPLVAHRGGQRLRQAERLVDPPQRQCAAV